MSRRILVILAFSSLILFSCAGGEKPSKGNVAQSDISQIVQKIADAEAPVEISHSILMEELAKLEDINSPNEYVVALKTKCGRLFDAEALHCQRAIDKFSDVNNYISALNVNQQTKDEVASIIGKAIESYATRKDALQKASEAISLLDSKTKVLPASLVDKALLNVKKSQAKAQESAIELAELCLKLGVTPAQN